MRAPAEVNRKYGTGDPRRHALMAMLECEDNAIGKVLDELERRGLADNTLILSSWPGRLRASTVSKEPVMFMDLTPALAAAAGGVYDAEEKTAVREERWKLVNKRGNVELFDLKIDVGEKTDLAARKPEAAAQLQGKFDAWSKANAPQKKAARRKQ